MNDIEIALEDLDTLVEIARQHTGIASWLGLVQSALIMKEALEKQLNGVWIPVSERLPNNCGLGVLLTIENKFQQRKVIQGFTGYMEKGKLEFHTNDKTTNLEIWKVIAWQPLPEPYKEVER